MVCDNMWQICNLKIKFTSTFLGDRVSKLSRKLMDLAAEHLEGGPAKNNPSTFAARVIQSSEVESTNHGNSMIFNAMPLFILILPKIYHVAVLLLWCFTVFYGNCTTRVRMHITMIQNEVQQKITSACISHPWVLSRGDHGDHDSVPSAAARNAASTSVKIRPQIHKTRQIHLQTDWVTDIETLNLQRCMFFHIFSTAKASHSDIVIAIVMSCYFQVTVWCCHEQPMLFLPWPQLRLLCCGEPAQVDLFFLFLELQTCLEAPSSAVPLAARKCRHQVLRSVPGLYETQVDMRVFVRSFGMLWTC